MRRKLRCNFRPSVHSFPRPPCGNGGFRKRAERDAVTSVDAGRPAGMRVSREHKARAARAKTQRREVRLGPKRLGEQRDVEFGEGRNVSHYFGDNGGGDRLCDCL